jgi:hypothetical protein
LRRLSLVRSPYYHYFEKVDNFSRWTESLERGLITTAVVYFRRIGFLQYEGCRYLQNYLEWRMRPKEVKRPFSDGRMAQINVCMCKLQCILL